MRQIGGARFSSCRCSSIVRVSRDITTDPHATRLLCRITRAAVRCGTKTAPAGRSESSQVERTGRREAMRRQRETRVTLDKEREFRAAAHSARLRYVTDADRGFARRRRGKSFRYVQPGARRFAIQRPSHGFSRWRFRRRGRTSGFAQRRTGTCRPPAGTRAAASSIATTRGGASLRTKTNTNASSRLRKHYPRFAAPSLVICGSGACRARSARDRGQVAGDDADSRWQ